MIAKLEAEMVERSSSKGTLAVLVIGGKLQDELARLELEAGTPVMGSSATMTGQGTKCLVEDVEPQILQGADIVNDYGRQKYDDSRTSSTMFDCKNMNLLRYGADYDVFRDALKRRYDIDLLEDPGEEILFSGHAVVAMNKY